MTELKTLRDIYPLSEMQRKLLRAEAIKWVKSIKIDKSQKEDIHISKNSIVVNSNEHHFVISFVLKHLHNLTIEDLKNE